MAPETKTPAPEHAGNGGNEKDGQAQLDDKSSTAPRAGGTP